jgi:hypothetical protein
LTVTSEYLVNKYGRGLKLINGVNKDEFEPLDRTKARLRADIRPNSKIVLSFGNTFGKTRELWLETTKHELKEIDPEIQLVKLTHASTEELRIWLGICDLVLFPTGDNPCERACFPIRVGTTLNAERVIATDLSPTEFHQTLEPYNCMVTGNSPKEIAGNIVRFFNDNEFRQTLETNVLKAKEDLDWDKLIK